MGVSGIMWSECSIVLQVRFLTTSTALFCSFSYHPNDSWLCGHFLSIPVHVDIIVIALVVDSNAIWTLKLVSNENCWNLCEWFIFLSLSWRRFINSFSPSQDVVRTSPRAENEISIFGISLAQSSLSPLQSVFLSRWYPPPAFFACFLDCLPTSRKQ